MSAQVDKEWASYLMQNTTEDGTDGTDDDIEKRQLLSLNKHLACPNAGPIYISTKSKIAYLNVPLPLAEIFWGLRVIPYSMQCEGIIKKQMKFNSTTQEELDVIEENVASESEARDVHVITSIRNPHGRIKFKDTRKISIGISRKDIVTARGKRKSAFYNCFVIILRIRIPSTTATTTTGTTTTSDEMFKEFHVKAFNTGKLEIPGIQNDFAFETIQRHVLLLLQPFFGVELAYARKSDTVLINSNFNCGFFVNREIFYEILKGKYHIQCMYDPCSYPGIQCKFYFDITKPENEQAGCIVNLSKNTAEGNIIGVSFMVFRTGSVLIVGMCDEYILMTVYKFLVAVLHEEFEHICQRLITQEEGAAGKNKPPKKIKKKVVFITDDATTTETTLFG